MRISEIFLRLGCSFVAWMIVMAYMLWLAISPRIGCDGESAELLGLLLFAAPAAAGTVYLTNATRPIPEVHRILRWIAVAPLLLLPFALAAVWDVAQIVYFGAASPCGSIEPHGVMQVWPVAQIFALIVCLRVLARMWVAEYTT